MYCQSVNGDSIQNFLNGLNQLCHFSFSGNTTSQKKGKKGLKATTVKIKFYHLLDASRIT